MAGAAEIRGVFTGSWHQELHAVVYEHIHRKLGIRAVTDTSRYPMLPEALAIRAGQVAKVQALWRRHTLDASGLDHGLSHARCVALTHCPPAGVSYRPRRYIQCRQYLCCPFCFYRRVDSLLNRLLIRTVPEAQLMVTVRATKPAQLAFPDAATIRKSSLQLARIGRGLPAIGGVSLRYLCPDETGIWCVVTVVMGVVLKSRGIPDNGDHVWSVYPATLGGIKEALLRHIRYPSAVLRERPTNEIWHGLNTYLRLMRSGELTSKGQLNVYDMQRSTYPAENMGLPAGVELGQLLQLRSGGELQSG